MPPNVLSSGKMSTKLGGKMVGAVEKITEHFALRQSRG